MKVTFIKVNMTDTFAKDALKPTIFEIIENITPKNIDLAFFDDRIEKIPNDLDSDIIAFSVDTFAAKRAYKLAKKYKKANNRIVFGGFHPSAIPKEVECFADTVLVGDAEDTWVDFLKDYRNGKEKKLYYSNNPKIYVNKKSILNCYKNKHYLGIGVVQTSRGCRYNCEFCSIKGMYKVGIREKEIEDVIKEVLLLKEKVIFFADDNLLVNKERLIRLCNEMMTIKKKWACQISIDATTDMELLNLMNKSGCFLVIIGFESLSSINLKKMNKLANIKLNDYTKAVNNCYKSGIMVYGCFVLGYDYETLDSMNNVYNFVISNNLAIANFNPLMVFPNTNLYDRVKREGTLLYDKWWLDDEYQYGNAMVKCKYITDIQLSDFCKNTRKKFYGFKNILRRLLKEPVNHKNLFNCIFFILINYISMIEIYRKQKL